MVSWTIRRWLVGGNRTTMSDSEFTHFSKSFWNKRRVTMITSTNQAALFLFWCLVMGTTQGFTTITTPKFRNAWINHRYRFSTSSSCPSGNFIPAPLSTSRTVIHAVATGCQEYGEQASLRSRVGSALGDIQRRIRLQRPTTVEVIEDVSDFDSILKSTKEQFVAVFFHSPVCKACQAAAPHFYKLSQKYSDVKFLSVPLTPGNKETLQQELGVYKFPFGHIYHSEHGLLDELPILRKLVPHFEERLKSHVNAGSKGREFSSQDHHDQIPLEQEHQQTCTE